MKVLKVLSIIFMLISVVSAQMDYSQGYNITITHNTVSAGKRNIPMIIKGTVFYVTKEQAILHKIYLTIFFAGGIISLCFAALARAKNKKIDWEKYWENRRDLMKNKK